MHPFLSLGTTRAHLPAMASRGISGVCRGPCLGCTAGWPVEWDRWHWPYRLIHRAPDDRWTWCPCTKEQDAACVDVEVKR